MLRQLCGHWRSYAGPSAHCALLSQTRRHVATSTADPSQQLATGQKYYDFTLKRQKHVPELQLTAYELKHDPTGAEYLHIDRNDKNNVFSIGFKTNPPDHTGVPHILEHTTLCGSEKYEDHQVKDLIRLTVSQVSCARSILQNAS